MSTIQTFPQNPALTDLPHTGGSRLRRSPLTLVLLAAAAAVALGIAIYAGIRSRTTTEQQLAVATVDAAIPIVQVVHPQPNAPIEEISLPGNTQAYVDSPIYARTSGYLKAWYFDIGAHVKKGQLLAEIDTPEVDQELLEARAQLETARANAALAGATAKRYTSLAGTGAVTQEQIDTAVDDLNAKKATVDSNISNVGRLNQLQSFEKVYAPFDGIITARDTDVGALIDAGVNQGAKELFHLAETEKLRVYVAVPEIYSRAAEPGAVASLTLDEFPSEVFHGTVVRNSNAINLASRTLNVEVDSDNNTGKLLPGAYVFVHLKLPGQRESVTVPSNTLLFRSEGLRVGLVHAGQVELLPITIGRDYGSRVEVVSGLQPSDEVVLDPADSLTSGTAVRVREQSASPQ
jgi:RND family efflux transporter MFP subunit